jgi:hypothetical protein
MISKYPNSWYVEQHCDVGFGYWQALLGSVGKRLYAEGYLAALQSFYPHPKYRLINNVGEVDRIISAKSAPRPCQAS